MAKTLENQPMLYYNTRMIYVWLSMLILLNACWLMLVLFTLPGNWLMVASTCLFAWWKWDDGCPFSEWLLIGIESQT